MKNRLLIVDDDAMMLQDFLNVALDDLPNFDVMTVASVDECLRKIRDEKFEVILLDLHFGKDNEFEPDGYRAIPHIRERLPEAEIIIHSGDGDHGSIAKARALGATSYLAKHHYSMADIASKIRTAINRLTQRRDSIKEGADLAMEVGAVFASKAMHEVFTQAANARRNIGLNVYIHGATGVGKELVAQAIGNHGSKRPFIAINCATIRENLVESELFGHEKGSFTSAQTRKLGKFELANGGDLFLDEIGCLNRQAQESLLRVLQNGEFTRVGGTTTLKVDVRVICATNDDLEAKIVTGEFRADLFERLAACKIKIPSLNERREDIRGLVQHFLQKYGRPGMEMDPTCMNFLESHAWPRNIRELENAIKQMVANCSGLEVEVADLPVSLTTGLSEHDDCNHQQNKVLGAGDSNDDSTFAFLCAYGRPLEELVDQFTMDYISQTSKKLGPETTLRQLAQALGMPYGNLHRRLVKYGIVI